MEEVKCFRNFICYRGGSDAGGYFAPDLFDALKEVEDAVGTTYYSLKNEENNIDVNFLKDPEKYLGQIENLIVLLTKNFFDGFIIDGKPNPESVTRIEFDEALKNPNLRFILVRWPDFNWDGKTDGIVNQDIISNLWGEEAQKRIVGSPAITANIVTQKKNTIEQIIGKITRNSNTSCYKIESSTPDPNNIFIGREKEIAEIDMKLSGKNNVLFLQGIGGIGKTQIAKQYAKMNDSVKYDKIICANYNGSLMDLVISQQSPFKLVPNVPRLIISNDEQESDEDYFKRKLELIKKLTDEKTLIVIFNYDVMADEDKYLNDFIDGKYKILFTTICDYTKSKYPYILIDTLEMNELKDVFFGYYDIDLVEEDDEHLEELINLVNRHTYTIELLAQHMEKACNTTEDMINALKNEGITSLNKEIHSSSGEKTAAYDILSKVYKVFDFKDDQKKMMKYLSLMPANGVKMKDILRWFGSENGEVIYELRHRSWIIENNNRLSLHPVVRDIVRNELKITEEEAAPFLEIFNNEIAEEYTWHFPMEKKCFYAEVGKEILKVFNNINDYTLPIYKNMELLLSFDVKPSIAIEYCEKLFDYYEKLDGRNSSMCAFFSFQAGWTYLFNLYLPNAVENAKKWFDISYPIFKSLEFKNEDDFAAYGHLLTHMARIYIIYYGVTKNKEYLDSAFKYAKEAVPNAENHLFSPKYGSRTAVAYMQLGEVYIASKEYDKALELFERSYGIVVEKFGANNPDATNVACRKTAALLGLERYQEAFDIGKSNLESYKEYFGEFNPLRFEQLIIVYRSAVKIGDAEIIDKFKDEIIKVGTQLMGENTNKIKDFIAY